MTTQRTTLAEAITVLLEDQRWYPLDSSNPGGVQMATLWGDPMAGPFGALLKMPPGFESPMHRHSNDERVVVVRGTSIHWSEGESRETAQPVSAGDFLVMPSGVNHVSAATDDGECLEFVTMDGKFDFTLA
ncbi:MAG TPA: cupin domain-containing protein [Actinomycetota bacterium]|nr:cupin domain-containing protein [Actinomycetota bacterium]